MTHSWFEEDRRSILMCILDCYNIIIMGQLGDFQSFLLIILNSS